MRRINNSISNFDKSLLKTLNESCDTKLEEEKEENLKEENSTYMRFKVSFYVDTDSMSHDEIIKRTNVALADSGLASAKSDVEVEAVEALD